MYLDAKDIASYIFCPYSYRRNRQDIIVPPLTRTEQCIKTSIISAERKAILKDDIVNAGWMNKAWDAIWWSDIAKNLTIDIANEKSRLAYCKFRDYCNYDISGWSMPTAGVEVESHIRIGSHTIVCRADIVKTNLNSNNTVMLVNITNKDTTPIQAMLDPIILTNAYGFNQVSNKTIHYTLVNISEKYNELKIITITIEPKRMESIRKMLNHISNGISNGVYYANTMSCEGCNICMSLK
jgi:low affinity Fe/Cu permease